MDPAGIHNGIYVIQGIKKKRLTYLPPHTHTLFMLTQASMGDDKWLRLNVDPNKVESGKYEFRLLRDVKA